MKFAGIVGAKIISGAVGFTHLHRRKFAQYALAKNGLRKNFKANYAGPNPFIFYESLGFIIFWCQTVPCSSLLVKKNKVCFYNYNYDNSNNNNIITIIIIIITIIIFIWYYYYYHYHYYYYYYCYYYYYYQYYCYYYY